MLTFQNTTKEIRDAGPKMALWGIGSTENHGETLPPGTDILLLEGILNEVKRHTGESSYIVPTMPFGTSYEKFGTIGTINLQYTTLKQVIRDVVESLYDQNIREVAIINGHGFIGGSKVTCEGNEIVKTAVRQLNYDHPDFQAIWVQPFSEASEELCKEFSSQQQNIIEIAILKYLLGTDLFSRKEPESDGGFISFPFLGLDDRRILSESSVDIDVGRRAVSIVGKKTANYINETLTKLREIKN